MFFYLFLLFIVLPIIEIMILVKIGMVTSFWVPIAIVVVTGMVGTALARREGWKVMERMRADMQNGQMPADSLMDAFLVLVAGVLFVLPGVLSDVVGIALLFPPTRRLVKRVTVAEKLPAATPIVRSRVAATRSSTLPRAKFATTAKRP